MRVFVYIVTEEINCTPTSLLYLDSFENTFSFVRLQHLICFKYTNFKYTEKHTLKNSINRDMFAISLNFLRLLQTLSKEFSKCKVTLDALLDALYGLWNVKKIPRCWWKSMYCTNS